MGDAPAGAPKGISIALWKPVKLAFEKGVYLLGCAMPGRGGRGDAPVGAPKGFPLALWKPSGAAV